MTQPLARIHSLRARAVEVPLRRPLRTGGGIVRASPLVLIDLQTDCDVVGSSYLFSYTPIALRPLTELVRNLEPLLVDQPLAPAELERKLQPAFRLLGPQGLTGTAMAGIDMAAWDALAKIARMPLVRLLGGVRRPLPAYNSCGMGLIGPELAGDEAAELVEPGFRGLKVRLGYPELATDLAVVRAARERVGRDTAVMVDYNQCLSVPEAMRRVRALDGEGVSWIEEPTTADDYAGHAEIRRRAATPIQLGENWWGASDMAKSIAAGAADLAMPDVMKIGGVSGWLRAAALAEAARLPVSSHLFPEISAHLLAVTPTAHWLEYLDLASPILQEPLHVVGGMAEPSAAPGCGLAWDEDAVRHYSPA